MIINPLNAIIDQEVKELGSQNCIVLGGSDDAEKLRNDEAVYIIGHPEAFTKADVKEVRFFNILFVLM